LTISKHSYTATQLFMDNDLYEDMSEELQAILKDAAEDYRDYQREQAQKEAEEGLEVLQDEMEVNELDEEQREDFFEEAQPIYDKYEEDVGEELMDLATSYRE